MKTEQQAAISHRRPRYLILAALLAAGVSAPAFADPAVHVAWGRDTKHDINKYEIGINWDSGFSYGNPDGWLAKLQWEVELAQWDARSGPNRRNVTELGFSPIIRIEKRGWGTVIPFVEGSIGVRLLSHTSTSDNHQFSTAFQFSDMIGLGVAFGPKAAAEAGFRFQHISNASIKAPNPGTNFYTGYVRYRF